jgi:hypothetical protein
MCHVTESGTFTKISNCPFSLKVFPGLEPGGFYQQSNVVKSPHTAVHSRLQAGVHIGGSRGREPTRPGKREEKKKELLGSCSLKKKARL